MKIKKITREEAFEQKQNKYFTGEPCLRGHIAYRWTLNGRCKECGLEDGRAKYKKMAERLKGDSK